MAKGKSVRKAGKKVPAKNLKEKRLEKAKKREEKIRDN